MDNKSILQALTTASIAIVFDLFFHIVFSSPPETTTYYGIKYMYVFIISYLLFKYLKPYRIWKGVIGALLFTGSFSIYYRITEYALKLGFLGRVPDLSFFGTTYNIYSDPLTSITLWTLIHGGAFFFGSLIANKVVK